MRFALVGWVFIALCSNCQAGLFMSFTADGSAKPVTVINVGETATLDVYLLQDAGEFNNPPYSAGLVTGGTRLDFGPEVQATAHTAHSQWDISSLEPQPAPMSGYAELLTAAFVPVLPTGNAIALGSVIFQGVSPGLATIEFSYTGVDQFVLDGGTVIDSLIDFAPNTAQIQVNGEAIPEPGSIGLSLLLFGAASAVTRFRARRKRKQGAADVSGPAETPAL